MERRVSSAAGDLERGRRSLEGLGREREWEVEEEEVDLLWMLILFN